MSVGQHEAAACTIIKAACTMRSNVLTVQQVIDRKLKLAVLVWSIGKRKGCQQIRFQPDCLSAGRTAAVSKI